MTKTFLTLACAAALSLGASAQAAVVGFDSPDEQGAALAPGDFISAGGFDFTLLSGGTSVLFAGELAGSYASDGSPSLFAGNGAQLRITASTGQRFDFGGFALGGGSLGDTDSWALGVTLTADDGVGTVSRSFRVGSGTGLGDKPWALSGLQSLTITPVNFDASGLDYSIDRLSLTALPAVSAVPEPGSWAMMGLGLLGLAAIGRRKAVQARG